MSADNYLSTLLYGVDNENCILTSLKYDAIIDSEHGKIGLVKNYDNNVPYYEVYLNDNFIGDADINSSENDILKLVKQNI